MRAGVQQHHLRLRANFGGLRKCWEQFVKRSAKTAQGINGWVRFEVTVRADGKVSALHVRSSSSFDDKELLGCMASVITAIPFDPPEPAPGWIVYPLTFQAS